MKKVKVGKSKIHGNGLFADEPIKRGDVIELVHTMRELEPGVIKTTPTLLGRNYNHSDDSNALNVVDGNNRYLVALKEIEAGGEITTDYRTNPELEQPGSFTTNDNYISFDYDDTLTTPEGFKLAQQMNKEGKNLYVITARDKVTPQMIERAEAAGIPKENIIPAGSDEAKVRIIKENNINKHIDNKDSVIKALGDKGELFVPDAYPDLKADFVEMDLSDDDLNKLKEGGFVIEEYANGGEPDPKTNFYTVQGSDGVYRKVNGKWEVDWNRSGNFQPLSKGDLAKRTAVLNSQAKPLYDSVYDDLYSTKQSSYSAKPKPSPNKKLTQEDKAAQEKFEKSFDVKTGPKEMTIDDYQYPAGTNAAASWESQKEQLPQAYKDVNDFYSNWYMGRATIPEFRDVALQRYNALNPQVTVQATPEFQKDHPESLFAATYRKTTSDKNKDKANQIFIANAMRPDMGANDYYNWMEGDPKHALQYFTNEYAHEKSHWYENNFPQEGTAPDYYDDELPSKSQLYAKGKPTRDYLEVDNSPEASVWTNDRFKGVPAEQLPYLGKPTELRARLNVWRMQNNIDPTKKYTTDEIRKIMDDNIKNFGTEHNNVRELYKLINNNPEALKEINDRYVSNDSDKELNMAANGGQQGDRFKKRLMKRYPGMQGVYGAEGENLNIVKDPNYDARSVGYGDIEFIHPGQSTINYPNRIEKGGPEYTFTNPSPDKYTSVYNPRGANRGDIFLDMMHGMRDDPNYQPLLQNFEKAVRDTRGGDMAWYYEDDVKNDGYTDGQEQWDENYIDSQLRAQLAPGSIGMFSHGRRDYRLDRKYDSPEMRTAAKDIRNYLKDEYEDGGELDTYPKGGGPGKGKKGKSKNVKPFITSDPKEYAYRKAAYDDSLNLYNLNKGFRDATNKYFFTEYDHLTKPTTKNTKAAIEEWKKVHAIADKWTGYKRKSKVPNKPVSGSFKSYGSGHTKWINTNAPDVKVLKKKGDVVLVESPVLGYKKPVQPVQFKKQQPPIVEKKVIEPTLVPQPIPTLVPQPIPTPLIINPELQKFVEEREPGTGADVMPVYDTNELPMYATPDGGAEWIGDTERYVDWDGNRIPYRLPRFRKPGHGGDLIRQGKKRYIPLPSIESRYQAEIVPEEEYADGGERKKRKKDSKERYRSEDGNVRTPLTPEMQAVMSPDEWGQYIQEFPEVYTTRTKEQQEAMKAAKQREFLSRLRPKGPSYLYLPDGSLRPQAAQSADWLWQLGMTGPAALKGVNAAMKIPLGAGVNVGGVLNAGMLAHGATEVDDRYQDWQDVAEGNMDWKEAALKTGMTALELSPAYGAAKKLLPQTYKINPFAGKLGTYNRVVGQDAVDDILESGLVRVNEDAGVAHDLGPFGVIKRTTPYPSFAKALPQKRYANQVIAQGKKPYIISTDRAMKASNLGRHGKGSTQFPIDETGKYMSGFPASEAKVFEYVDKPHWLKGYPEVPTELPGSPNSTIMKSGMPNPLALADAIVPRLPHPIRTFTLGMAPIPEELGAFTGSPLNFLPGYGKNLGKAGNAFRKFGNTMENVQSTKTLSPKGGSPFRMGKDQIVSEGNWASLKEPAESYSGTFAAEFDFAAPGSNLGYLSAPSRNGVLITDRANNTLVDVPVSDPGLSFHRRLPFSNRYVPINKEKLLNNKFQLATQGGHFQSLVEKYGYGLAYAGLLGAMGKDNAVKTYNKYTIDPVINEAKKIINNINPEIVPKEEFKKGGEPKKKKRKTDDYGRYRSEDGNIRTPITPEMQAEMSPEEWGQYVQEVPEVYTTRTKEQQDIRNALDYQQRMAELYPGRPTQSDAIQPADWLWQLGMLGPAGLEGLGALAAKQIPRTGLSVGTIANTGFGIHGATQVPQRIEDWQDVAAGEKDWKEAAAESLMTGLELYGGYGAAKELLPQTYNINPWAVKENPDMMLYRARPVGQNPDMNMAAQLRAKEAAGESLTWYQRNLLNPQTNPEILAREKYYGQWFDKDPSRLEFYMNPGTRNFADKDAIEILRTRLPRLEANKLNISQFDDAKLLSASPETEFILPKDMISSAETFPESSWQQLIQEDAAFNKPHWLRGYPKELPGSPNTFKSSLGSMDMSKYEIKNPDYFTQLLNTYDSRRLSNSNKQFYKDLIANVKKQNGIATERQYNELQRLRTGNFNFGKKGYSNGGPINLFENQRPNSKLNKFIR
jgi:hypothetical protein